MKGLVLALLMLAGCHRTPGVRVGSKLFTESVILGEIATQLLTGSGIKATHRRELGGTRILWNALVAGEIDVYPEYTGTLREEILGGSTADLATVLATHGVLMSKPLGFNDAYAIGMRAEDAQRLGIRSLSDLAAHPEVKLGISHEFMSRHDGWEALRDTYRLRNQVEGLDHDVAYRALDSGAVGATDLYSTDAEIERRHLRVLVDDLKRFPLYQAVLVFRKDLAFAATAELRRLEGRIDETTMIAMNAEALAKHSDRSIAAAFLQDKLAVRAEGRDVSRLERLLRRTREHVLLVGASLLMALLVAIPLGILAAKRPFIGQLILAVVGILQTIPSIAVLVLMIPLLGIGPAPALLAMFLYSLLPIVRNTAAGITGIPRSLRESAETLGLSAGARLRLVELPMASRSILAGIKTSAVLNVGTATLGALIGAGGYGQPILSGIRLDDTGQILEGAIPAAVLALLVQGIFEIVERLVVPRGLRIGGG